MADDAVRSPDPLVIRSSPSGGRHLADPRDGGQAFSLKDPWALAQAVHRGVCDEDNDRFLAGLGRVRVDAGGKLYRYDHGVYRDDGDEFVRAFVREIHLLVGDTCSTYRANEAVRYVSDVERIDPLSLDRDERGIIRARNGIVDVRKVGEAIKAKRPVKLEDVLEPYTPENASTIRLPWDYDPTARCPKINEVLWAVQCRNGADDEDAKRRTREAVALLYQIFGYTLLSWNPLRKAFLFKGDTAAGKSVTLSYLEALVGGDAVTHVSFQTLGDNRFAPARLVGKLANIYADIPQRAPEDSDIFKSLTGGSDKLHVERKGVDGFDFAPSATLLFSANEFPGSRDISDAYFGRWIVLDFPNHFADDANTEAALRALGEDEDEMRGLLRWAVEGVGCVLVEGTFRIPETAVQAHAKMREAVDTVAGWLASDRVILGDGGRTKRDVAFADYKQWMEDEGKKKTVLSRNRFYERLRQDPRVTEVKDSDRYFDGIKIVVTPPDSKTVGEWYQDAA